MARMIELDGTWYVLTDPVPRLYRPESKRDGMQCLCSGIEREATAQEVEAWKGEQRKETA